MPSQANPTERDVSPKPDREGLAFALTGTDYRSPVTDPDFAATRPFWDRPLPSESPEVYRVEHLAARLLDEHGPAALTEADDLPALVRQAAQTACDEGYERGVHDHDATLILTALPHLHESAGLLRHEPAARAAAHLFWAHDTTAEDRDSWTRRAVSLARARDTFGLAPAVVDLVTELAQVIGTQAAATYRFEELTTAPSASSSAPAAALCSTSSAARWARRPTTTTSPLLPIRPPAGNSSRHG